MVRIEKHYIKKGPLELLFICKTIFWPSRRCCLFHNTKELHSFSFVQSWINFLAFLSYRMEVVSEKNQNKTNQLKELITSYQPTEHVKCWFSTWLQTWFLLVNICESSGRPSGQTFRQQSWPKRESSKKAYWLCTTTSS